ncbi:hypothetical protein [Tardiphaga sp. 42S5]|uniref:hypothetical protein n=1 Tax=Tardiphaga sp. 42S5 TaxID=1404799 RepID=UPI002A5ABF07|nr:hypothetical protein [Tardiphaga sp. 42S5]WPO43928.1 hypothetical protein SFY93_12545 [Tardiphaga sp. 42S5]
MTTIPNYTTEEDFFFKTPPYTESLLSLEQMSGLFSDASMKVDGFCPTCRQVRTFKRYSGTSSPEWVLKYGQGKNFATLGTLIIQCTRVEAHQITFDFHLRAGRLQKTGQWPSFADIALDESKDYSKLLSKQDSAEFHKAIGLAAHNVGIGSYVYLRRIFERIIINRFEEFKAAEGWKDEQFYAVRMEDKLKLLHDHLPPFLVKNAKIYSILSLGIHELEEEQCLGFFKVLRQSLILILEQDKKLKEELQLQRQLEKDIAGFSPKPVVDPELSLATLGNLPTAPEK